MSLDLTPQAILKRTKKITPVYTPNDVPVQKSALEIENERLKKQLQTCKEQRNLYIEKYHSAENASWYMDQYKCDRELELIK